MVLVILMVVPVAKLYCSKKLRISIIDYSVSTKRLVSSAYCDNLVFSFWFGMGYPTILSLFSMLRLITFPFTMLRRKDKGHPCLTPLDKGKGLGRKPLLEIIDSVFWYSFSMNFIKISEYPNFLIIWYKISLPNLSNAFS